MVRIAPVASFETPFGLLRMTYSEYVMVSSAQRVSNHAGTRR
jgi:hypothetical protein